MFFVLPTRIKKSGDFFIILFTSFFSFCCEILCFCEVSMVLLEILSSSSCGGYFLVLKPKFSVCMVLISLSLFKKK